MRHLEKNGHWANRNRFQHWDSSGANRVNFAPISKIFTFLKMARNSGLIHHHTSRKKTDIERTGPDRNIGCCWHWLFRTEIFNVNGFNVWKYQNLLLFDLKLNLKLIFHFINVFKVKLVKLVHILPFAKLPNLKISLAQPGIVLKLKSVVFD